MSICTFVETLEFEQIRCCVAQIWQYFFVPRLFSTISGRDGGQNGRKTANVEVKNQKSAKMNEILNV